MWQIAGFAGGLLVLAGYFYSVKYKQPNALNWSNVFGAMLMTPSNLHYGAIYAILLTASFGLIGAWGILQSRKR